MIDVRKPTRPKLTPSTGTAVPRDRRRGVIIVPSPPSTTARSGGLSPSTSSTSERRATSRSRSYAVATRSRLPCRKTAARRTASADFGVDPVVEVIGEAGMLGLDEVQERLAVALRAGQAGVDEAA